MRRTKKHFKRHVQKTQDESWLLASCDGLRTPLLACFDNSLRTAAFRASLLISCLLIGFGYPITAARMTHLTASGPPPPEDGNQNEEQETSYVVRLAAFGEDYHTFQSS